MLLFTVIFGKALFIEDIILIFQFPFIAHLLVLKSKKNLVLSIYLLY